MIPNLPRCSSLSERNEAGRNLIGPNHVQPYPNASVSAQCLSFLANTSGALGMRPKFQAQERAMLAAHVASSTATLWQGKQTTEPQCFSLTLNQSTASNTCAAKLMDDEV